MDLSFISGVAAGVCLGVLVMAALMFRPGRNATLSGDSHGNATFGAGRRGAPARRHNKRPRDHRTPEEVQADPNVEKTLV